MPLVDRARRAQVLALAALLTACGERATIEPSPTFVFEGDSDVELAWQVVDLPYLYAFAIAPDPSVPPTCPRLTRSDDGARYEVEGGCTDATGNTWTGRMEGFIDATGEAVSYRFDYQALSSTGPDGMSITADGVLEAEQRASASGLPAPSLRAETLTLTLRGNVLSRYGRPFPGDRTLTLSYRDYAFTWDGAADPAGFTARATVEVEGRGELRFDLAWGLAADCPLPTSGALVFEGANRAELVPDDPASCDDCLEVRVDGVAAGMLCWAP